jgi:hypothetical protein
VIDKLAVRVPRRYQFTHEFSALYARVCNDPVLNCFRETPHYTSSGDLRPFGHDAILQLGCKHGDEANHKFELIDTGEMTLRQMSNEIERVFAVHALDLEVMRLDLAADVPGVTIRFFQEHTRVKRKRFLQRHGVIPFVSMGKGGIQTLTFGKRPNVIRIYDKVAEYKEQYRKLRRKLGETGNVPPFEDVYRVSPEGYVLTRVERQMGGGRIPPELATVRQLPNCAKFNPFTALEIISTTLPEPDPNDYSFMELCTGLYLQHFAMRHGAHEMTTFINRHSKRNGSRIRKKFEAFLPRDGDCAISSERLLELFRASIAAQFQGRNSLA